MKLLRFLELRSWGLIATFIFCGLVGGSTYSVLIIMVDGWVAHRFHWGFVWRGVVASAFTYTVARFFSALIMLRLSQAALSQMRVRLCWRILHTSQERLKALGTPQLLAALTSDVEAMSNGYRALVAGVLNVVVILSCLIYLMKLYFPYAFAVCICLLLGGTLQGRLVRWPLPWLQSTRQRLDVLYRCLDDMLGGTRELQLNKIKADYYIKHVVEANSELLADGFVQGSSRYAAVNSIGDLLFFAVVMLILAPRIGFHPPPNVMSSTVTILLFLSPVINDMLRVLPILGQANVSLSHLDSILDLLDQTPLQNNAGASVEGAFQKLELRNIQHVYSGSAEDGFRVGPLNLTIRKSEIVFLVGGNGSGKSTLAMLMLGLFQPQGGSLHLNGMEVSADSLDRYRAHFSAIFADYQLFDTLFGLGVEDVSKVNVYLRQLRLDDKVSIQDGRFSTTALSSGQRKRLALVLSYLEDRPIYLFDEWASDQDPDFRHFFYTELLPNLKAAGKAVIAITHDDRYFYCADRIIQLQDGKILPETMF